MPSREQALAWTFLNSHNYQDSKSKEYRTKVRSHISRLQHARVRATLCQSRSAGIDLESSLGSYDHGEGQCNTLSRPCALRRSAAIHDNNTQNVSFSILESCIVDVKAGKGDNHSDGGQTSCSLQKKKRRRHCETQCMNEPSKVSETLGWDALHMVHSDHPAAPDADTHLTGRDSFAPVPYKLWYGWLTDYWYHKTVPESQNLLKASSKDIENYTVFLRRQEHAEPALYYMSLLLASGIPLVKLRSSRSMLLLTVH